MRTIKTRIPPAVATLVLLMVASAGLTGCGKDEEATEYIERTGRISSIDLSTGVVKVWVYSPKHQKEIEYPGTLAPNAEILVNGKTARLEEARVDDRVRVTGRLIKREGAPSLIATMVEIMRPELSSTDRSSQPVGAGPTPDKKK